MNNFFPKKIDKKFLMGKIDEKNFDEKFLTKKLTKKIDEKFLTLKNRWKNFDKKYFAKKKIDEKNLDEKKSTGVMSRKYECSSSGGSRVITM